MKDQFAVKRHRMVAEQIRARGIRDERLLAVMGGTPRHLFVPSNLSARAYDDGPLPIGDGQTISQPYIVAEMTAALRLAGTEKVLEIGTGSGYQTAILCRLAKEVVTVERLSTLQASAEITLRESGVDNVRFRTGDGSTGIPDEAPFDRIIVTAAAPGVPPPLFEQLSEGGIIVIPIGGRWEQDLVRVTKESGKERKDFLGGCRFVPLIGEFGFPD
ncbi:MAG: protein-L-isoaspartate o-methyltransferase [Actinobacteria bacterium]|nr:protein-L-isoaspartate o-methyltransferase [Actinomycetota bacterium]MBM2827760.1 protein-L-isoaspartate o-methyltransferase [Actinomycetota bacterium]